MKCRFVRYRFVRYWFRFVSRPSLDTDIPSKHFVYLQDVFKTCLQDVFSVIIFCLPRRLKDISQFFVLEDEKLLCWRRVEDVFKTCLLGNLSSKKKKTSILQIRTVFSSSDVFVNTIEETNWFSIWKLFLIPTPNNSIKSSVLGNLKNWKTWKISSFEKNFIYALFQFPAF